jgi:hypothetical protein
MRPRVHPLVVAGLGAVLAACVSAAPATPTPSPATPLPTRVPSSPGASSTAPDATTYWLRLTTTQALAPLNLFPSGAQLVITGSGVAVMPGPVPAIFPGPLVVPLVGRPVTDAGRAKILALATSLGLIGRQTDFSAGTGLAGGVTAHVEITVDGKRVTLSGPPDAQAGCSSSPCSPAPATPEAFGAFWRQLLDLPSLLGDDLGPETTFTPSGYSILVGPPPGPAVGVTSSIADWPLAAPLATFGAPVANGQARCATVTGDTAATLGAAFARANALSQWTQDPTANATFGLIVRPLVPGEDACREVFGLGQ